MARPVKRDPANKAAVRRRDHVTCQKCGQREGELHTHHIIPLDEGGEDVTENMVLLCYTCHHEIEMVHGTIAFEEWLALPPAIMLLLAFLKRDEWSPELTASELANSLLLAADAVRATHAVGLLIGQTDANTAIEFAQHAHENPRLKTRWDLMQ